MKKNTLFKNAFILTATSFILRTLGIVVRSYMSNKIGAEGMGLYQLIISIYVLATTFATAGISTAVIRLITDAIARRESDASLKKIMKKTVIIAGTISIITIMIFYFFAEIISIYWLKDVRCIPSIKILVLALPFISIASCIKGYFLAKRKVLTNSCSQLFEQFIRIIFIFIFLELFDVLGLEKICMYIILSDVISEIAACVFLYVKYKKETINVSTKKYVGFRMNEFSKIAFPIAINKYITSILRTIENILIPNKLAIYTLSREISLSQFGYLKGMALPLIFFPASFLTALSTLLVPEASEANALNQKGKISKMVEVTFKFTIICAILISAIFFIYSSEIGNIFYSNSEVGFYIKCLAPLIPFMYLESAIVGMMQGLDQQKESLKYNIIDSTIRISMICIVLPGFGINGFIFVMYVSNIVTSGLNMFRLLKISNVKINWNLWIMKPLLSVIAACTLCNIISRYIIITSLMGEIIFKIGIIGGTYLGLLFLFGIVKRNV